VSTGSSTIVPCHPARNRGELEWRRHNERRQALEELLAKCKEFRVRDWGETKDETRPHEFVEVTLELLTQVLPYANVPGLTWLGRKLAESAVDKGVAEAVKALVSRLRHIRVLIKYLTSLFGLPMGPPSRWICLTTSVLSPSDLPQEQLTASRGCFGNCRQPRPVPPRSADIRCASGYRAAAPRPRDAVRAARRSLPRWRGPRAPARRRFE
jgi:hypothetical protein